MGMETLTKTYPKFKLAPLHNFLDEPDVLLE
jgi:hypothetical protein